MTRKELTSQIKAVLAAGNDEERQALTILLDGKRKPFICLTPKSKIRLRPNIAVQMDLVPGTGFVGAHAAQNNQHIASIASRLLAGWQQFKVRWDAIDELHTEIDELHTVRPVLLVA